MAGGCVLTALPQCGLIVSSENRSQSSRKRFANNEPNCSRLFVATRAAKERKINKLKKIKNKNCVVNPIVLTIRKVGFELQSCPVWLDCLRNLPAILKTERGKQECVIETLKYFWVSRFLLCESRPNSSEHQQMLGWFVWHACSTEELRWCPAFLSACFPCCYKHQQRMAESFFFF